MSKTQNFDSTIDQTNTNILMYSTLSRVNGSGNLYFAYLARSFNKTECEEACIGANHAVYK